MVRQPIRDKEYTLLAPLPWTLLEILCKLDRHYRERKIRCRLVYEDREPIFLGVNLLEARGIAYCDLRDLLLCLFVNNILKPLFGEHGVDDITMALTVLNLLEPNSNSHCTIPSIMQPPTVMTDGLITIPYDPVCASPYVHNNADSTTRFRPQ
ncbi:unnamed protein product [Rodentolepis nana]|uniref:Phosphorylase b kinase regulatory subunit n=1 Tax=Rodentolepis nana TaxID=102285 RepID=A0A0R3T8L9_RODNA|nr:unnamed protein product [Rodentolepis nana]